MPPKRRAAASDPSLSAKKPKLEETPPTKAPSRNDLDRDVEPITNVDAAFQHMLSRARGLLSGAGGQVHLRVATMCSGTEAPIFAMKMVQDVLERMAPGKKAFVFTHEFACEIVNWKQGYILRNTDGAILYSDMRGFVKPINGRALTAMGSMAIIPTGMDIIVSGCSCVDFSTLNSAKRNDFLDFQKENAAFYKSLGWEKGIAFTYDPSTHYAVIHEFFTRICENVDHMGSSGQTFFSMLSYALQHKPKIIILENVSGAPWTLTTDVWFPYAGYTAVHIELDTKNYYIPQTRQRGYLIALNNDVFGKNVHEIIKLWTENVKNYERRASAPVNSWLLPPADELTERARQDDSEKALRNPTQEPGWDRSRARHSRCRHNEGLGNSRRMTQWDQPNPQVYDRMDRLVMLTQPKRVLDCIEINQLRALKGVDLDGKLSYTPYDAKFKNRVTDLSQNIDRGGRTQHGMAGCITPGGIVFLSDQNRMLSGFEALALQGLPVKRIKFATETQDQLRDLAGNAMTTTVFGAVFIALLQSLEATPGALRKFSSPAPSSAPLNNHRRAPTSELKYLKDFSTTEAQHFSHAKIVQAFLGSRRYCFCNGSAKYSTDDFVKCAVCGTIRCKWCAGNPPHEFEPFQRPAHFYLLGEVEQAMMTFFPGTIASLLASKLSPPDYPMSTAITIAHYPELVSQFASTIFYYQEIHVTEVITIVYSGQYGFELRAMVSESGITWYAYLNAWSDGGVELREDLGLTPTQLDRPIAKAVIPEDAESILPKANSWELWSFESVPLQVMTVKSGNNLSIRVINIESLNVPPRVSSDLKSICGTYSAKPHCDTPEDSLHVNGKGDLFLFKDATRAGVPEDDVYVISNECRMLETHEYREVILKFPPRIDPRDVDDMKLISASVDGFWITPSLSQLDGHPVNKKGLFRGAEYLRVSSQSLFYVFPEDPSRQVLAEARVVRDKTCDPYSVIGKYKILNEKDSNWATVKSSEVHHIHAFLSHFNVKLAAVQHLAVSFKIMEADAYMGELNAWRVDPASRNRPYGQLPRIIWVKDGTSWVPRHLTGRMATFERNKRNQPDTFELRLKVPKVLEKSNRTMYVTMVQYILDHKSLAYTATGYLPLTEDPQARVTAIVRVDRNAVSSENMRVDSEGSDAHRFVPFRKALNSLDEPRIDRLVKTHIKQGIMESFRAKLSPKQERSLAWMLSRELGSHSFREKEIEEELVSCLKLRLVATAERDVRVHGGVLADDVGYGKTVVTLACMHHQRHFDQTDSWHQRMRDQPTCAPLKATLILVPDHLVDQWVEQIQTFYPESQRNSIVVIKKIEDLTDKKTDLRVLNSLRRARVIVVSTDLFVKEEQKYWFNLAKLAGSLDPPCAKLAGRKDGKNNYGRAFEDWYRDAVRNLRRNMVGPLGSNDTSFPGGQDPKTWGDGIEKHRAEQAETYEMYAQDYKSVSAAGRSSAKVRKGKLAGDGDEAGVLEKAPVTGKIAMKDKTIMHALEGFSFARLIYDEFSYDNPSASLFVAVSAAHSKWVLSATPPTRNLAAVCEIAKLVNLHIARSIISRQGVPSITEGPQLEPLTDAEDLQRRKFISDKTICERHEQGMKFLRGFTSANPLDKTTSDGIKVTEIPIVCEMSSFEFIYYHGVEQELRACSFDAHQLPPESRCLLEGLVSVKTWNEDGRTISTEALVARASWGSAFASGQSLESLHQLKKDLLENSLAAFKMNAEKAIWLCRRVKNDETESGYDNAKNAATDVYMLLRDIWSKDIARCGGIDAWTALCNAIITHGADDYDQVLASVLNGTNPPDFFENEDAFIHGISTKRQTAWNDYYDFKPADLKELVEGEAEDLVRDFTRVWPNVEAAQKGDGGKKTLKSLIAGGHLVENRWQCQPEAKPKNRKDFGIPARPTKAWYKGKLQSLGIFAKDSETVAVLQGRLDDHIDGTLPLDKYFGFGKCKTVTPEKYPVLGGNTKVVRGGSYTVTRDNLSNTSIDLRKAFEQVIYAIKQERTIRNLLSKDEKLPCDGCGKMKSRKKLHVVYECGHLLCKDHLGAGSCGDHGPDGPRHCESLLQNATLPLEKINSRQRSLGATKVLKVVKCPGASEKTNMIVNLIRRIPLNEKILVFAQFTDQMDAIQAALKSAGIKCTMSATLEAYPPRVRILKLNDVTSAGSNFQYANHVIFATPLLAKLQEDWDAFMRQAQGRCIRYGQKKHVYVYHFVTANTIEVDILELRRQSHIAVKPGSAIGRFVPAPPENNLNGADDRSAPNRVASLLSQQEIWKAMNEQNWLTTVGIEY
ncbi:hypothetical protein F5Y04DRAFT_288674 [Hypomontagnella monticulosa]|nr:hypothetical protein F5Y04DRAFT_288674 [Hypomontagnella monticulosa]